MLYIYGIYTESFISMCVSSVSICLYLHILPERAAGGEVKLLGFKVQVLPLLHAARCLAFKEQSLIFLSLMYLPKYPSVIHFIA